MGRTRLDRRDFMNSLLPTLLAIHAIREGRAFKYDVNAHKAVAV